MTLSQAIQALIKIGDSEMSSDEVMNANICVRFETDAPATNLTITKFKTEDGKLYKILTTALVYDEDDERLMELLQTGPKSMA